MTELPHTRTRTVHWLTTAAAIAAVISGSALIQSPDATARSTTLSPAAAEAGPDASQANYPIDCGTRSSVGVDVVDSVTTDFDGDGHSETIAVASCAAGAGNPPQGIYVLAQPDEPGGRPEIVETLVPTREQMNVKGLDVSGGTVSTTLLGYSTQDVPRCCPDQQRKVKWVWQSGKFVLQPAPLAGSAQSI